MESRNWEGQILPMVVRTISQAKLNDYAEASGDHNPLHLDAEFAAQTQFGGIVAHGMLTLGLISEMLTTAFGRPWLANGTLKVRFKGAIGQPSGASSAEWPAWNGPGVVEIWSSSPQP